MEENKEVEVEETNVNPLDELRNILCSFGGSVMFGSYNSEDED